MKVFGGAFVGAAAPSSEMSAAPGIGRRVSGLGTEDASEAARLGARFKVRLLQDVKREIAHAAIASPVATPEIVSKRRLIGGLFSVGKVKNLTSPKLALSNEWPSISATQTKERLGKIRRL